MAAPAVGRMILALLSARFKNLLPERDRKNAEALGSFVNRHRRWREIIFFGYCFLPLPSNPRFIAAGAGKMPLAPVTVAFFLSRAIADTFWVWVSGAVTRNVGSLFINQLTSWKAIVAQVGGIVMIVLIFRLPWARWLGIDTGDSEERPEQARSDSSVDGRDRQAGGQRSGTSRYQRS